MNVRGKVDAFGAISCLSHCLCLHGSSYRLYAISCLTPYEWGQPDGDLRALYFISCSETVQWPCRRSSIVWVAESNWRGLALKLLTTAIAVTFLHSCGTHTVFSRGAGGRNGQIDRLVTTALVCRCLSVLNQTAMSSTCRAKHLGEMCCHENSGGVTTCRCPALFHFFFFFYFWSRLVSSQVPFCWWWTCLLHPSHTAWCERKKKCFLTSSSAEYFCHFQTAWWLTAFHARTMLLWRRDGCYHSLVTYIYILLGEVDLFLKTHSFLNLWAAGEIAV